MVVRLKNYNILENIFTAFKKISSLTMLSMALFMLISTQAQADVAKQVEASVDQPTVESAAEKSAKAEITKDQVVKEQPSADLPKENTKAETSPPPQIIPQVKMIGESEAAVVPVSVNPGNPEAGKAVSTTCVACHGADGNSPIPMYPKLAGQHASYLNKMLLAYQALKDPNSENATHKSTNAQIMYSQIMNLSPQDLADLAAFFSSQKTSNGETTPNSYDLGRKIYLGGDLERGIPACAACHSPAGLGNDLADFPKLSGQHGEYIKAQLLAFKNDERLNDMMQIVAKKLTDEEMAAVSSYASGLH